MCSSRKIQHLLFLWKDWWYMIDVSHWVLCPGTLCAWKVWLIISLLAALIISITLEHPVALPTWVLLTTLDTISVLTLIASPFTGGLLSSTDKVSFLSSFWTYFLPNTIYIILFQLFCHFEKFILIIVFGASKLHSLIVFFCKLSCSSFGFQILFLRASTFSLFPSLLFYFNCIIQNFVQLQSFFVFLTTTYYRRCSKWCWKRRGSLDL